MRAIRRAAFCRAAAALLPLLLIAVAAPARAQEPGAKPPLTAGQLEQLVAPIALYPDALLAQVLMASTYPLEVVEAARWAKANPKVTGKALEDAMQQQNWDPSVKSLTAFPQTLDMMNEKLDWTAKLGDAFLAQQNDLMNAVQVLRNRAEAAGNLKSNQEQTVTVQPAPAAGQPQTIIIQPANPQVVYVPTYNPTVVYGAWPYPAYPPYTYYPPGYVATASIVSFGVGMAVGAALWGGCSWGSYGGDVKVNVNTYNTYNRTNISNGNWQHNVDHRRAVPYGDQATRQKYDRTAAGNTASREAFRGRAEQGRQQIAKGGVAEPGARGGPGGDRAGGKGAAARGAGDRAGGGDRQARAPGGNRGSGQQASRGGGAFSGVGNGNAVRQESARGRASSANAANWSRPSGGGGGGGGGGGRGGGGGGGRSGGGGGRRR